MTYDSYSIGAATKALREGTNIPENLKILEEALEKKEIADNVVASNRLEQVLAAL